MNESKITVLIVEDDPIIAADIKYLMQDLGYAPFPPIASAADAMLVLNNIKPDLALIDVSLEGDTDGVELATEINLKYPMPIIFLTTHHDRQTIDRIKTVRPSAYLVKPLEVHNLQTSIELALYNYHHQKPEIKENASPTEEYLGEKNFFVKVKNQLKKISLEQVLYIEAYDNYSFLHLAEGGKTIVSSNLKVLEGKLSERGFVRIHRSYLINLHAIEGIEEDVVLIKNAHLPVGKTYREDFMKRLNLL
jgi:DNA-binding LytR/AlgR family response regulator